MFSHSNNIYTIQLVLNDNFEASEMYNKFKKIHSFQQLVSNF